MKKLLSLLGVAFLSTSVIATVTANSTLSRHIKDSVSENNSYELFNDEPITINLRNFGNQYEYVNNVNGSNVRKKITDYLKSTLNQKSNTITFSYDIDNSELAKNAIKDKLNEYFNIFEKNNFTQEEIIDFLNIHLINYINLEELRAKSFVPIDFETGEPDWNWRAKREEARKKAEEDRKKREQEALDAKDLRKRYFKLEGDLKIAEASIFSAAALATSAAALAFAAAFFSLGATLPLATAATSVAVTCYTVGGILVDTSKKMKFLEFRRKYGRNGGSLSEIRDNFYNGYWFYQDIGSTVFTVSRVAFAIAIPLYPPALAGEVVLEIIVNEINKLFLDVERRIVN